MDKEFLEAIAASPDSWQQVAAQHALTIMRMREAAAPFMKYYDDIRFNLRKQPRPTDAAIEERGERVAIVTWAEFYALRDALNPKRNYTLTPSNGCIGL